MLKIISKTFLGLMICALGFFIAYFYLSGIDKGSTPLLLIPAIFFIILGAYLLMRAGKSDEVIIKKPKLEKQPANSNSVLESTLEKNNELSSKWAKTVDKRDRLKLLEISAAEEESE